MRNQEQKNLLMSSTDAGRAYKEVIFCKKVNTYSTGSMEVEKPIMKKTGFVSVGFVIS